MNLWPRRIITGLGLLLLIALLLWGISSVVRAIASSVSGGQAAQSDSQSAQSGAVEASEYALSGGQMATADGLLTDGTTIDIPACPERDIAASATAESIRSGSALPVALTLGNRGNVACSTSLTRLSLRVTTGDQTVYNSASCADSQQVSTTLLLRPTASWTGSLTWDGRVYADGCTAPTGGASPAPAGTYKLALVMDGREVASTVVDVAPAPTPAPTPQSGAQSGSQSGAQSGR